jgi:hypothetical protein
MWSDAGFLALPGPYQMLLFRVFVSLVDRRSRRLKYKKWKEVPATNRISVYDFDAVRGDYRFQLV